MTNKLTPEHLKRRAIVYVRQSSFIQVVRNRESQFFATSDLTALVTCSKDLSDATVTRSPLNKVFEPAKLRPTLARLTIAVRRVLRIETVEFIC